MNAPAAALSPFDVPVPGSKWLGTLPLAPARSARQPKWFGKLDGAGRTGAGPIAVRSARETTSRPIELRTSAPARRFQCREPVFDSLLLKASWAHDVISRLVIPLCAAAGRAPKPPRPGPEQSPPATKTGKDGKDDVVVKDRSGDRIKAALASGPEAARAIAFFAWVIVVTVGILIPSIAVFPLVALVDKQRKTYDCVGMVWSRLCTAPFFRFEVVGPPQPDGSFGPVPAAPEGACVYVSNHQSWLDAFAIFALGRHFKVLARTDVIYKLPVFGLLARMMRQVPVEFGNREANMRSLDSCRDYLADGMPLWFFAEGRIGKMRRPREFKRGAFLLASELGVPIVPVTIVGTARLMPASAELTLRSPRAAGPEARRIVIHGAIETQGRSEEDLLRATRQVVLAGLPSESDERDFDERFAPRPAPAK